MPKFDSEQSSDDQSPSDESGSDGFENNKRAKYISQPKKPSFSTLGRTLAEKASAKNVSEVYELRYAMGQNGEPSVYADRFDENNPLPLGEWRFLINAIDKSLNKKREEIADFQEAVAEWRKDRADEQKIPKAPSYDFVIFDFGCGDGRDLQFYQWLAQEIRDINIVVKAYDISSTGIESYKTKLKDLKFEDLSEYKIEGALRQHGIMQQDNLVIELLSPVAPDIDPQLLVHSIGTVDVTSSLYGPTSHIFPSATRDDFLESLRKITRDDVVLTVPGQAMFKDEQQRYGDEFFRGELHLQEGEIFYSPADLKTTTEAKGKSKKLGHLLPYMVYNMDLLQDWLDRAGVKQEDAAISVVQYKTNPDLASKNKFWGVVDNLQAMVVNTLRKYDLFESVLPQRITRVEYYGVEIKGLANEVDKSEIVTQEEDLTEIRTRRLSQENSDYKIGYADFVPPQNGTVKIEGRIAYSDAQPKGIFRSRSKEGGFETANLSGENKEKKIDSDRS
ncbi:MAG: class I SAM-dependent methyltransferase [Pseudomonadota bacterium]